jgi:hypothetical protein
MIWLLLTLTPVALVLMFALFRWPALVLGLIGALALGVGWILLFCYGGWQMGWFTHCGNFWESAHCGG